MTSPSGQGSLADAELGEDDVEQVFGGGFAGDFAEGVDGAADADADEVGGLVVGDGAAGGGEFVAGAGEGLLMADAGHEGETAVGSGQANNVAKGFA